MTIPGGRGGAGAAMQPPSAFSPETAESVGDELALDDFDVRPRWGGAWTLVKLETLKKYLVAYTNALKHQPFRLLYIDAFAGTGTCDLGGVDVHNGSASIALDVRPPFHEHIFIERNTANCTELQRLLDRRRYLALKDEGIEAKDADARVIQGDANEQLVRLCAATDWTSTRAVLFLDPFGMEVEWASLQRIAATKAVDVWYLFPLHGVYRQMARNLNAIDPDKRAILSKTLGTDEWERDFYEPPRMEDMFGDPRAPHRHADWRTIADWVTGRLRTIFVRVAEPKLLYHTRPGSTIQRAPLFALYFAVSNPRHAAAELACRIADHILRSDIGTAS